MTASRMKRLGKLEQVMKDRTREQTERALELLTDTQLEGLLCYMDQRDTPEGEAAGSRLIEWGNGVPEIRDAPDLGSAGLSWWKRFEQSQEVQGVPLASSAALADLTAYVGQWEGVAARPDCPERDAARALVGVWAWWAALARVSRGEGEVI